ncbi:MAG: hypothetical protein QXE78_07295 [Nitrososphaeria archaeon]
MVAQTPPNSKTSVFDIGESLQPTGLDILQADKHILSIKVIKKW